VPESVSQGVFRTVTKTQKTPFNLISQLDTHAFRHSRQARWMLPCQRCSCSPRISQWETFGKDVIGLFFILALGKPIHFLETNSNFSAMQPSPLGFHFGKKLFRIRNFPNNSNDLLLIAKNSLKMKIQDTKEDFHKC
jgi:hypothetical protein